MLGQQLYRGLHPYSTDSILQLQVHLLGLPVGSCKLLPRFTLYTHIFISYIVLCICAMDACHSEWSDVFTREVWLSDLLESSTLRHILAYLPFWVSSVLFLVGLFCYPIMDHFGLGRHWLVQGALPFRFFLACTALHCMLDTRTDQVKEVSTGWAPGASPQ